MTLSIQTDPKTNYYNFQRRNKLTNQIAASVGTTAGVVASMALIAKGKGINTKGLLKNPKKAFNVLKNLELNGRDVITIASSSVAGGFLGGVATDSQNAKSKVKEGITQLIGNYIIPTAFVSGGIKLNKVLNHKFNFPPITKIIKFCFGMASLAAGVVAGNKVSNKVNSVMFKEENKRKLNWKDWAEQVDNVCLVTSLSASGTNLAKAASKVIPFALLLPGYSVGVKTNPQK